MGDDHLSTFSTEEIVPIPREFEETSRYDSKNVLPSCDDFSSIKVPRDNSVTFSNPLFEFDVNFNNPLFDEELEDIECKDSYDSNFDESTFLSPENFHTIIESIPTSTTLIENSDPNREEIDIFSGPDDSRPPGIESDFDLEEDIIDNLLNENPTHERLTFNIEPDAPVINNVDELNEDECFDPGGGENNVEVDDSFTIVTRTFLPFLAYPEVSPLLSSTRNEDTIYDPGIFT
ncbi:hypothetical protein Tco_0911933 [Tanacetum coccineum]